MSSHRHLGSDPGPIAVGDWVAVDGDRVRSVLARRSLLRRRGAGKSTLVNALAGHELAPTAEVRSGDRKGRHTTTARELHQLADAICVIDTPGVRELGLWTGRDTVDEAFADVSELAEQCRFSDCTRTTEPGCAAQAALLDGSLDRRRFESWEALRREAESAELRGDPVASRRADRKQGCIYRQVKEMEQHHRE